MPDPRLVALVATVEAAQETATDQAAGAGAGVADLVFPRVLLLAAGLTVSGRIVDSRTYARAVLKQLAEGGSPSARTALEPLFDVLGVSAGAGSNQSPRWLHLVEVVATTGQGRLEVPSLAIDTAAVQGWTLGGDRLGLEALGPG